MDRPALRNSTNVRSANAGRTPTLAVVAWAVFVVLLEMGGALDRLADDVPWIAAFASAVALLAYGVDAELRRFVEGRDARLLAAGLALVAAAPAIPTWAMLIALPVGLVLAAALLPRPRRARFSSTAAASPGGRPGGP